MSNEVRLELDSGMEQTSDKDLNKVFEAEVDDFSKWMEGIPDYRKQGALTLAERALLKTYLKNKFSGNIDSKRYT